MKVGMENRDAPRQAHYHFFLASSPLFQGKSSEKWMRTSWPKLGLLYQWTKIWEEETYPGRPRFETTFQPDLISDQRPNFRNVLKAQSQKNILKVFLSFPKLCFMKQGGWGIVAAVEIHMTAYVCINSEKDDYILCKAF